MAGMTGACFGSSSVLLSWLQGGGLDAVRAGIAVLQLFGAFWRQYRPRSHSKSAKEKRQPCRFFLKEAILRLIAIETSTRLKGEERRWLTTLAS
jgi:hypothetical protein